MSSFPLKEYSLNAHAARDPRKRIRKIEVNVTIKLFDMYKKKFELRKTVSNPTRENVSGLGSARGSEKMPTRLLNALITMMNMGNKEITT